MKVKDVIQELKRFNFDFETNIIDIKKKDSDIIFKIKEIKDKKKKDYLNG